MPLLSRPFCFPVSPPTKDKPAGAPHSAGSGRSDLPVLFRQDHPAGLAPGLLRPLEGDVRRLQRPTQGLQRLGAHRAEAAALSVQLPLVQSGQQLRRALRQGGQQQLGLLRLYAVQRGSSRFPVRQGRLRGLSRRVLPPGMFIIYDF